MKLIVFGATGATGQQVVTQALRQGHEVTAFIRNPEKMASTDEHLRIIVGNVTDVTRGVADALRGHDIVISTLGRGNSFNSQNLIARSVRTLVPAMENLGVKRLIFTSAIGVGNTSYNTPPIMKFMQRLLLRNIYADKAA